MGDEYTESVDTSSDVDVSDVDISDTDIPEDTPEDIPEDEYSDSEDMTDDVPEDISEDEYSDSEDMTDDVPEDISEDEYSDSEDMTNDVPEDIPEDEYSDSEDMTDDVPEDTPEDIPEDEYSDSEDMTDDVPEDIFEDEYSDSEDMTDDVSEDIPEDEYSHSEDMTDDVPKDIPEDEYTDSDDIGDDVPEDVSEDVSTDQNDDNAESVDDTSTEDTSDTDANDRDVPEDVSTNQNDDNAESVDDTSTEDTSDTDANDRDVLEDVSIDQNDDNAESVDDTSTEDTSDTDANDRDVPEDVSTNQNDDNAEPVDDTSTEDTSDTDANDRDVPEDVSTDQNDDNAELVDDASTEDTSDTDANDRDVPEDVSTDQNDDNAELVDDASTEDTSDTDANDRDVSEDVSADQNDDNAEPVDDASTEDTFDTDANDRDVPEEIVIDESDQYHAVPGRHGDIKEEIPPYTAIPNSQRGADQVPLSNDSCESPNADYSDGDSGSNIDVARNADTSEDAFRQLSDYMNEHNYGRDDYDTYSQDPEWKRLHSKAFPDYTHPETSNVDTQEDAFRQLSDYMNEHNYGQDDYDTYSQDPEWQRLHNKAFPDYTPPETSNADTQEDAFRQLSDYMNEHNYGQDDYDTYSQDPEWQRLHSKAFPDYTPPETSNADTQENAFRQLSDYMNKHNYGQDDYDTYSQDPEWQRLHSAAFPNNSTDTSAQENISSIETDDTPNIDFSEMTNEQKLGTLEKRCRDNSLVQTVDFHDFDPDVAVSMTDALADAKKDFPNLNVNYVGSIDSQVKGIHDTVAQSYENELRQLNGNDFSDEEYRAAAKTYADNYIKRVGLNNSNNVFAWSLKIPSEYDPTGGGLSKYNGVAVNNCFAGDNKLFTECKINEVATKHKPIGCDTPRATADHELGHEIDKLLNASSDKQINDMYNKMLSEGNAKNTLSTYSATNVKEFIAEAYSEYRNNPSPREYSTAVYNRLIELRNMKGGIRS